MRFRIGMRSLLLLMAAACVALWAIPAAMDWYHWRTVRAWVSDCVADLASSQSEPKIILGVVEQSEYCLSNLEVKWDSTTGSPMPVSFTPRRDAVYVEMPDKTGKWVSSTSEVVRFLRQDLTAE
jgi:hypothetical protein